VKNIVLPKDNEKDLADIPKNVLDSLNVFMVESMDEVLKLALEGPVPQPALGADGAVKPPVSDDAITH
jgi:ATP-dependent Lon protease